MSVTMEIKTMARKVLEREPTQEMLQAGCKASLDIGVLLDDTRFSCERACWEAMFDAAPAQGNSAPERESALLSALEDARDNLYNGFEPDNQSRAWHRANDAISALQPLSVAHHGAPILTARDAKYCEAMIAWIRTVREHCKDKFSYGPEWLPSGVDIEKSRLFWRLRSGKQPLPHPPPTCYSCPWYEVVEEPTPHWTMECWEAKGPAWDGLLDGHAIIGQCGYKIERRSADGFPELVSFGPWQFTVKPGKHPQQPSVSGFYIQIVSQPEATPA